MARGKSELKQALSKHAMNLSPSTSSDFLCTSSADSKAHPYYLIASGYQHADLSNRLLHRLCSWLNLSGQEAWMITTDTNTSLRTPRLHDGARAQHLAAKKCPIVVSCSIDIGSSTQLGLKVRYLLNLFSDFDSETDAKDQVVFTWNRSKQDRQLKLPLLNLARCTELASRVAPRHELLVVADAYLAAGGLESDLPRSGIRLTSADLADEEAMSKRLSTAKTLYLFEPSPWSIIARAYGCEVVHIRAGRSWANVANAGPFGSLGLVEAADCRNMPPVPPWLSADFLARYRDEIADWRNDLDRFIASTQALANQTPFDVAWPEEVVLSLPPTAENVEAAAVRADRVKQLRINQQLAKWTERSSLREIDGEIYANYVASGQLPSLAVVVYADEDMDALANTLESLGNSLLQPSELTIISPRLSPFGGLVDGMTWIQRSGAQCSSAELPVAVDSPIRHIRAPWVIAIKAGATLQPNCLLEFAITAQHTQAVVLYADDDIIIDGQNKYPQFKPDANIEWLRSTNYLGEAVALSSRDWQAYTSNHRFEGVYEFALAALRRIGASGLCHLDTLLVHGSGRLSDSQLASEDHAVKHHLAEAGLKATIQPATQRGLRNISYSPIQPRRVSVVVPCATQTGYLTCLLQSMASHASDLLFEVLVVTDNEFADRVQHAIHSVRLPFTVHLISIANAPYSHAQALNAGARQALGDVLLFADDDTEITHNNWLEPLCGYLEQSEIAAVAPRLVRPGSPEPTVCGGPAFLGLSGLVGIYCGEGGNVFESGVFGRLQAAQDVSAFAPHFFLISKAHYDLIGGFDEAQFPLALPVLDFALRAKAHNLRHVWTPLVNVLHQGGKTLEEKRRLPENALALHQNEWNERQRLLKLWTDAIGADPNYNRNLSLAHPFDLEQDIVVDWQPKRHDRPRTLALPLSSGAGQYRIVEPLNALQDAGKAQSCVVFPIRQDVSRVPTPIELVRSGLDRLIVQNAISDLQMARMEEYRQNLPKLGVIHMLDDLFGNLPSKHYLHNYHKREGGTRLRRSLELSDRLVVTTQPLKEYYEAFVAETRVIPNSLVESAWFDLPVSKRERKGKLRVGWAGAQQHLGDLEMIQKVVAHFSDKVDWIFMGMCPPSIRPYVAEIQPFVSINVYPQTLANLDLDIAIAPLEDNHFNACKSNLRLLEYGAMGWPVVCSDVYPFRTDDPPVKRVSNEVDDWIAALDILLNSESLRQRMGQRLNRWVKSRYALSLHTDAWFKAIFDPIQR
ncbi:MAG TPA: glycosyltransferase [Burkholderiaceae bacterium]|nr:glycosyltransferase [Burkholderiaceae bacterium]